MLDRFRAVFESFQKHDVRYVVIGGIAAILHGVPRAALVLDVLIEAMNQNARNLLKALLDAKIGTASLISAEEVLANEITVFKDQVRLDVRTFTPGLTFEKAWAGREAMVYKGQTFNVVSRQDLISSKKGAGRRVDLEDVRLLELNRDEDIR